MTPSQVEAARDARATSTRARPPAARATVVPTAVRRAFALAEPVASGTAGRIAERLWLRVPRPPDRTRLALPPGGDDLELRTPVGTLRGRVWGSGPVVHLVHGWGGWAAQWRRYVPRLVERGLRVVAVDAPSHGRSGPGPTGPRSGHGVEFSHALAAVAAEVGPARAVVAHSVGALAAGLAIVDWGMPAERLVLLAPFCDLRSGLDDFGRALSLGPRTRRELDGRLAVRVGRPVSAFDLQRLSVPVRDRLPLLVVHDEHDDRTPLAASSALVDGWPEATLVTTSHLGHFRLLADPDVAARVADFVAAPDPTAAAHG